MVVIETSPASQGTAPAVQIEESSQSKQSQIPRVSNLSLVVPVAAAAAAALLADMGRGYWGRLDVTSFALRDFQTYIR